MESVVRSGKWSWLGPHETAFCKGFADFVGSRYCLALANGTVTMQCALQAVGVIPGDEVIVPGLTWCATAQAVFDIGADVVFVDIDPETLCIDPKAIMPVHLYGCMCDMDAISEVARTHKLKVVEDAAHQHGSRWRNRGVGPLGDAASFSFQHRKVRTCGEGGAVTTNDEETYKAVHALKQVGWGPDGKPAGRYGHNYRMTEMQAVLLRGGLVRLPEQTRLREENAARIREGLARLGGPLRAARRDPRVTRQAYYAMTLVYEPKKAMGLPREAYRQAVAAEGCPLGNTYAPAYAAPLLNLYDRTSPVPFRDPSRLQDYRNLKLPRVERAVNETALVLSHVHLLGRPEYIQELLRAVEKIDDNLAGVASWWREKEATQAS
jgi:dTDP-4-amino-4,6-dideoxygalactose transaminase